MQLVDGLQIQIKVAATFLILFGAPMTILFMIKVKILVLIKWSYTVCPL